MNIDITRRGPRFAWIQPDAGPAVYFDTIVSETHTNTSELTEHPVEIGSDVTDNVRHDPESVSLEGIVTNSPTKGVSAAVGTYPGAGWQLGPQPLVIPPSPTPLSLTGLISAGVSALGSLLFGTPPTIATTLQPPGPIDVIATVHNALTVIERSGQLCTVFASTKQYDSMAITSVSCERNKLGSMVFKVELKRVNIVATASVAAPKPLIVAAVPPKAAGPQTPAPMSSAEKASILKQGLNAVVGGIAGGG